MKVKDMFLIGEIMEWEDKDKSIKPLSGDDCVIVGKTLNIKKIILNMKRTSDGSEGNVFTRLIDPTKENFVFSKKLLASKSVMGKTLNEFREMEIESL
jgi:hypothetical protein